jgi:hypothetical protein
MGVETVLLTLLGVVALWLAVDAGRERHRLRARMARSLERAAADRRAARAAAPASRPAGTGPGGAPRTGGLGPDAWRYWPLTLPAADDGSVGPRL